MRWLTITDNVLPGVRTLLRHIIEAYAHVEGRLELDGAYRRGCEENERASLGVGMGRMSDALKPPPRQGHCLFQGVLV